MKRKMMSVLLVLTMVMTLFPAMTVFAGATDQTDCEVTWKLTPYSDDTTNIGAYQCYILPELVVQYLSGDTVAEKATSMELKYSVVKSYTAIYGRYVSGFNYTGGKLQASVGSDVAEDEVSSYGICFYENGNNIAYKLFENTADPKTKFAFDDSTVGKTSDWIIPYEKDYVTYVNANTYKYESNTERKDGKAPSILNARYTYDVNGNTIFQFNTYFLFKKQIMTASDMRGISTVFDDKGRPTEKYYHYLQGSEGYETEYTYTDDTQTAITKKVDDVTKASTNYEKIVNTYDEQENLIKTEEYDAIEDGAKWQIHELNSFDAAGNLTQSIIYNYSGTELSKSSNKSDYTYTSNSDHAKAYKWDTEEKDWVLYWEDSSEYDSKGHRVKHERKMLDEGIWETKTETFEYEEEFDASGKRIKAVQIINLNGEPSEKITVKYTYLGNSAVKSTRIDASYNEETKEFEDSTAQISINYTIDGANYHKRWNQVEAVKVKELEEREAAETQPAKKTEAVLKSKTDNYQTTYKEQYKGVSVGKESTNPDYLTVNHALEMPHGYETKDNPTVIILSSDHTESIKIPAGRHIILDLNGHMLTGEGTNSAIVNEGTLTIVDSNNTAEGTLDVKDPDDSLFPNTFYFKYNGSTAWTLSADADEAAKKSAITLSEITSETEDDTLIKVIGGCIIGAADDGISNYGTLTMYDINVVGTEGIFNAGVFTMESGKVIGNDGAGVYTNSDCEAYISEGNGTFVMKNGTIAYNYNSGVDCVNGIFHMYGGKISHNTAKFGGGVNNGSSPESFHMHGGEITDNYAKDAGGGVYTESLDCTFDGKCIIKNNKAGRDADIHTENVCISDKTSTNSIEIGNGGAETSGALASGSEIGITILNNAGNSIIGKISSNGAVADKEYFFADNEKYCVKYVTDHLELVPAVCKIGNKTYETLAEAVAAVKKNETIVLLANNTEDVTVTEAKTFKLSKGEYTCNALKAAEGLKITESADGTVTVKKDFGACFGEISEFISRIFNGSSCKVSFLFSIFKRLLEITFN